MLKCSLYNLLRRIKRYFNWLILPDSAAILKSQQKRIRRKIYTLLDEAEFVLDVGSGTRPISKFKNVIRIDIDPCSDANVIADAHYMPFTKGVFDLVWLGGVLEHIRNPKIVLEEIYQILKDGGYVYIEIPFFQRVHGAPYDYQRFTLAGLEELCKQFSKVRSGVICGPSSAFSHILRSYLALCLSFNNRNIYNFFYYYILGWLTLPIKYFDIILFKYKNADAISFAFYYFGRKI